MNAADARLWPDKPAAVIVIEVDPDRVADAVQEIVQLARLSDWTLFGPILHVAIEDVAQAVLKHFERAELSDLDPVDDPVEP